MRPDRLLNMKARFTLKKKRLFEMVRTDDFNTCYIYCKSLQQNCQKTYYMNVYFSLFQL